MKLIVGLGNPGPQYAQTRHNAGFMVVDRLASRHELTVAKAAFHAVVGSGRVAERPCVLMQPTTFMNRSGFAVAAAAGFYKLPPEALLIVVDDVALPCGRLRLRAEGGAGGHNGLLDVERALGTDAYPRLRIGIDPPASVDPSDYVLGRFSPDQLQKIEPILDRACDAIESWVRDGIDKTMSQFNAEQ